MTLAPLTGFFSLILLGGAGNEPAYLPSQPWAGHGYRIPAALLERHRKPADAVQFARAAEAFRRGDHEGALGLINAGGAGIAGDVEALNLRGACLTELHRYEEAKEAFTLVLQLQPGHFWARYNLAEIEFMQGNAASARAGFTAMLGNDPAANELLQFKVVLTWLLENNLAGAEAALGGMADPPVSLAGHMARAACAAARGNPSEASTLLAAGRKVHPGQWEGLLQSTWQSYVARKDPSKR